MLAGAAAIVAFLIANPYALFSFSEFKDGLNHQTTVADDAIGKLGLTEDNGVLYYLWTFTWGLGFVPAIAALAYRLPRRRTSGISAHSTSRTAPPAEPVTVPSRIPLAGGSPVERAIRAPTIAYAPSPIASVTPRGPDRDEPRSCWAATRSR